MGMFIMNRQSYPGVLGLSTSEHACDLNKRKVESYVMQIGRKGK
jgi:hypothetical protein